MVGTAGRRRSGGAERPAQAQPAQVTQTGNGSRRDERLAHAMLFSGLGYVPTPGLLDAEYRLVDK